MPHISKRKLDPKYSKDLHLEFVRSFERALDNIKTHFVFSEFFTRTEKVMFAKRLAIIGMLHKKISSHVISEVLFVSPSTVGRMSLKFEEGKYQNIIDHALGKKDFWKILEDILNGFGVMPPKYGNGRWKFLDKRIHKKKLRFS